MTSAELDRSPAQSRESLNFPLDQDDNCLRSYEDSDGPDQRAEPGVRIHGGFREFDAKFARHHGGGTGSSSFGAILLPPPGDDLRPGPSATWPKRPRSPRPSVPMARRPSRPLPTDREAALEARIQQLEAMMQQMSASARSGPRARRVPPCRMGSTNAGAGGAPGQLDHGRPVGQGSTLPRSVLAAQPAAFGLDSTCPQCPGQQSLDRQVRARLRVQDRRRRIRPPVP